MVCNPFDMSISDFLFPNLQRLASKNASRERQSFHFPGYCTCHHRHGHQCWCVDVLIGQWLSWRVDVLIRFMDCKRLGADRLVRWCHCAEASANFGDFNRRSPETNDPSKMGGVRGGVDLRSPRGYGVKPTPSTCFGEGGHFFFKKIRWSEPVKFRLSEVWPSAWFNCR